MMILTALLLCAVNAAWSQELDDKVVLRDDEINVVRALHYYNDMKEADAARGGACSDQRHTNLCTMWKNAGYCSSRDPRYDTVPELCKKTCGVCSATKPAVKECTDKATIKDYCTREYEGNAGCADPNIKAKCLRTCGECSVVDFVCHDIDSSCSLKKLVAKPGARCNILAIRLLCQKTCQVC